jgi:coproporphyrinogen III oxidase
MSNGKCWFGGGIDLTPHYIIDEDAKFFHQSMKNTCDKFSSNYYPEFKKWADDYFYIKHRQETRGIGGIFFDRLSNNETFSIQNRFDFVKAVGESFLPTYLHIVKKNKNKSFTQEEKNWQLYRRGRYVEFNLIYDAGTKFGLETGGRIESILMSLPKQAEWIYNLQPPTDSREYQTLQKLKKEIDWINA